MARALIQELEDKEELQVGDFFIRRSGEIAKLTRADIALASFSGLLKYNKGKDMAISRKENSR